jgi:PAS domain S-box-containing protein
MPHNHLKKTSSLPVKEEQFVYSQLIEGLPIAIYGCDTEGRVTFFNRAAKNLWGREAEIGKDLWSGSWKIYKTDGTSLSPQECPMAIALKEGRMVYGQEIVIERPDGTRCNVIPHPQPIFNHLGIMIGAVNSLVDITKQKNDQKALIELERSNNELTSFSYIASHDLQEPIRKIITFSDKLKEQFKDYIPQDGKEYLNKIIQSSKRMRQLIEDILHFSRVSNTNVEKKFSQVDLNETLQDILQDFDQRMLEKKATIKSSNLPTIESIPFQMNQLFHNLIGNSLKFSSNRTPPVITIVSRPVSEKEMKKHPRLNSTVSYCKIIIRDNGIGFSSEFSEQIFTLFQRLHGQSKYAGTGIGLALCRKIVENHNGLIYAKSKEGYGACFHIIIPYKYKSSY